MPVVPHSLTLDAKQVADLAEIGITSPVHLIKGEELHHSACRIDGYTSGHYVFFISGTMTEHITFLKYLFGESYSVIMPFRFRGLTVFGSPTQKFVKEENLVTISEVNTSGSINY